VLWNYDPDISFADLFTVLRGPCIPSADFRTRGCRRSPARMLTASRGRADVPQKPAPVQLVTNGVARNNLGVLRREQGRERERERERGQVCPCGGRWGARRAEAPQEAPPARGRRGPGSERGRGRARGEGLEPHVVVQRGVVRDRR